MSNMFGESTLKETVSRFFASVIYFLGICVIAIIDYHRITSIGYLWRERFFTICVCGSIVAFIVEIILENLGQNKLKIRLICHTLTYVILQVSCFFIVDTSIVVTIFFVLLMLAVFVLKSDRRERFEKTLVSIVASFLWALTFSKILSIMIFGVLIFLDSFLLDFFGIGIEGCKGFSVLYRLDLDVKVLICALVFPVIFLKGVPKIGEKLRCPKLFEKMLKFIAVPAELFVLIILNVYSVSFLFGKQFNYLYFMTGAIMILPIYIFTLILLKQFEGKFCEKMRKWAIFLVIPVVLAILCIAAKSSMNNVLLGVEHIAMLIGITSLISLVLIKIKDSKYQHLIFLVFALAILICRFGPF